MKTGRVFNLLDLFRNLSGYYSLSTSQSRHMEESQAHQSGKIYLQNYTITSTLHLAYKIFPVSFYRN